MNLKINLDTEKIANFAKANVKNILLILCGVILIVFSVLTSLAIFPREDKAELAEGQQRLDALDIRFNTKLLTELGATKQPAQLGSSGGRDPFSSF